MQNQNMFTPGNLKLVEVNNFHGNPIDQKLFIKGLRNARSILSSLRSSIKKSRRYETRLLQCKASHPHTHRSEDYDYWGKDDEADTRSEASKETKSSRCPADLAESWSTICIVCLQYQYEELSKRYSSLLRSYDARCRSLDARDATLARLQRRVRTTQARAAETQRALIEVGDRYLAMRDRRNAQKVQFAETVRCMTETLSDVMRVAQKARSDLDAELARKMAAETDVTQAMLLAEPTFEGNQSLKAVLLDGHSIAVTDVTYASEFSADVSICIGTRVPLAKLTPGKIRKCNRLCLENMRLKIRLEQFTPSSSWNSSCLSGHSENRE